IPLGRPLNGSEIRVNMGNRIVKGADTKDSTTVAIIRDAPADSSPSDIVRLITGLERLVETAVASGFEDALRRAEGDTGAEEALARGLLLIAIYEAREGDNYPRALRLLDIAEGKLGRDALRGKKVIEAAREAGKTTAALLKEATRIKKAIWQERAEAIWRGNPNHSKLNVARIIEKETGESYHTIRQGIVKPK
ncbi:MAG: hypothetical protein Q8P12_02005, partial [bacterium]|nr:hypothetical protein [bacterium]